MNMLASEDGTNLPYRRGSVRLWPQTRRPQGGSQFHYTVLGARRRCRFRSTQGTDQRDAQGCRAEGDHGGANRNIYIIVIRNDLETSNAGKGFPAIMADIS